MKMFTVLYTWAGREYSTSRPGYCASDAMGKAAKQIIAGGRIIAVQPYSAR